MTREEALSILKTFRITGDKHHEAFDMAIKALEQTRWIPVTEKLPEYGVPVLTYDGFCYCVEKRIPAIRDYETGEPILGEWWVSDDYVSDSEYYPNLRDGACIAWMPLPGSYRESEDRA